MNQPKKGIVLALALFFSLSCNLFSPPAAPTAESTPTISAALPSTASSPGPASLEPTKPPKRSTATAALASQDMWWKPPLSMRWQWQLSGMPVDTGVDAGMFDIDLFENDASLIKKLHTQGSKVVCYMSAGSREDWRPDKDQFPASVIGKDYAGWPGENWLDIRQIELLAPVMRARLDMCREKGFDGIEPDNIDGYTNDTGFPLTYQDQIKYNLWLADEAHARGLSIGLKNDPDQVADLLPYFDWALTEDCFAEGWCKDMLPFIQMGKPVFSAEYTDSGASIKQLCPQAGRLNFNLIIKDRELTASRQDCP